VAEQGDELSQGQPARGPGDVLVGRDRDLSEEIRHLRLRRPAPDPHRVQPGVSDRERQVALAGDPIVGESAEPVEAEAER